MTAQDKSEENQPSEPEQYLSLTKSNLCNVYFGKEVSNYIEWKIKVFLDLSHVTRA